MRLARRKIIKGAVNRIFKAYQVRILSPYGYDAYIYTEAQEALEKELVEKGVKFVRHLNVTDYQNKELVIEDTDGRWLAFGLKIKG